MSWYPCTAVPLQPLNDNTAQLLAARAEITLALSIAVTPLSTKADSEAQAAANSVFSVAALERPQSLPKLYIYHVKA